MKVFLSYAVGQLDAAVAARLRAVAAAYDISILLPDRTAVVNGTVPADTLKKIGQSDAVIALFTRTALDTSLNLVNAELRAAAIADKPVVALVEQGVLIQGVPENQIVHFDPSQPTAHEHSLMNVLQGIRQDDQQKGDLTALGWIAGITLGLVALNDLLSDQD